MVLFRKRHCIVVKSYTKKGNYYFTVVNTKNKKHCHVFANQFNSAKMICIRASEGKIPEKYPLWMKNAIRRLLDE